MRKALGCTLLAATLIGGVALPVHALPTTDPTDTTGATGSTGALQQAAATLTPQAAAALRPTLQLGSRSPAVVYVQQELGVSPTSGYFGPLTQAAVRTWQQERSLPATGVVDAAVWAGLLATQAAPAPQAAPAAQAAPASQSPQAAAARKPALKKGSRGPAVVYVQQKLGVTPASGYYGTLTRKAVKRFQAKEGLARTGRVSKATWKVLLAAEGALALPGQEPGTTTQPATDPAPDPGTTATTDPSTAPPTPEQAAAARPALSRGAGPHDPAVIYLQRFLRVTPTTGFFGTLTRRAVVAYQSSLGLPATGTVDAATWDAVLAGRTAAAPAPTPTSAPSSGPTPSPATIKTPIHTLPAQPAARDLALVFALAQVGKPYVLGGNGPAVFDCSGLVQQAYLSAGVRLPRLASQQRFAGTEVPIDQLLPGDLLYYQDGSSPRKGHISMYAGDGLVVEAANPRRGVRIRTLHESWYRARFVAAVRIG